MRMELISRNPYKGKILERFTQFDSHQVRKILEEAQEAFNLGRNDPIAIRADKMKRVSAILLANKEKYALSITREMGKIFIESVAEIEKCAWVCDYYGTHAAEFLQAERIETDASQSMIRYEPMGVLLAIMPWNFPFWQVFRCAAPALMAGNGLLLKHASNVMRCALHIEDIFIEAGFSGGIFRSLLIGSERVAELINHPVIKAITLTGGEDTGRKVAQLAGKNIKKNLLELGGSNAFIVLKDADLMLAVETGVKARMQNAGQSCIAAKRFIVEQSVADRFTNLFLEKVNRLVVGDPLLPGTDLGPLATVRQAEQVMKQVKSSIAKGARPLIQVRMEDAFFYPLVLADVKPGMPVFDEEVFGPVAAISLVQDEHEAIRLANQSVYGLGATIFTGDMEKARKLSYLLDDGAVFINSLVKSDPRLPFGGTKRSGYGRELSVQGIREFVNVKTVYFR
jgi:succinate-semialdehyde dehydrogenase / glutarate-semialdehyde dehydrogenase